VSPVKYELGFYIPEDTILHSHCRVTLTSYIALTGWTLQWRSNVSPVKYEMGLYIPEENTLHSHRRENLKSYIIPEMFNDSHGLLTSAVLSWRSNRGPPILARQGRLTRQDISVTSFGLPPKHTPRWEPICMRVLSCPLRPEDPACSKHCGVFCFYVSFANSAEINAK
jgi:hypothetical protein